MTGGLVLRLTEPLTQSGGSVGANDIPVRVDGSGSFSVNIVATNDPATQQVGAAYQVIFQLNGSYNPNQTIYIEVPYTAASGTIAINACPEVPAPQGGLSSGGGGGGGGSGGGGGGGGGGASNDLVTRVFPFAYNTAGILTGAAIYTPTVGDIIYDWWVQVSTAWDGTTPRFDLIVNGLSMLLGNQMPGTSLAAADAASGLNPNPLSWSDSIAIAVLNGTAIPRRQIIVESATPILGCVSQDGSPTAVAASVGTGTATAPPVTVSEGVNDTFVFIGPSGTPQTFTVAPQVLSSHGAFVAAMNAATTTGSVAFDTIATASQNILGQMTVTMNIVGASQNGSSLQAGPTDFLALTGIPADSFLEGGTGGSPGSTHGSAKLYVLTSTPA